MSLTTAELLDLMRETAPPAANPAKPFVSAVQGAVSPVEGAEPELVGSTPVVASTPVEPSALVDVYEGERSTGDRFSTWDIVKFGHTLGFEGRPSKSLFVTLKLRLEVEQGRRRPYTTRAGRLPDGVHPIIKASYDGFVYLLQYRWHHTPLAPAPWTKEFAAAWCGITERQAKDARRQLVKMGALVHVGNVERAKLWLPSGHVPNGDTG